MHLVPRFASFLVHYFHSCPLFLLLFTISILVHHFLSTISFLSHAISVDVHCIHPPGRVLDGSIGLSSIFSGLYSGSSSDRFSGSSSGRYSCIYSCHSPGRDSGCPSGTCIRHHVPAGRNPFCSTACQLPGAARRGRERSRNFKAQARYRQQHRFPRMPHRRCRGEAQGGRRSFHVRAHDER